MRTPIRRILASLNLLTVLILLGALFILVNYIANHRYARLDLTKQKITALSDQTIQTLKSLKEPVSVVVFYQPSHRLYQLTKDLLDVYTFTSPQLRVEYVDPEQDIARAKQLAKQFQIEDLNLVIFEAGSRHKYVSDTDLAEYDYSSMAMRGEPRVKAFKGEDAFTSAIISVTQAQSPLAWIVTGHGEKAVESSEPDGLADLKKALEQQNMTIQAVTLLERKEVPADVKLIIIPGPTHRLTESEVALLQSYLDNGGALLALIDPLDDTGLDGLLERWGIQLGMDIVVDPARQLPFVSAANLFITTYTKHPIAEKMKTLTTLYPLARSVRPAPSPPSGVTVTPLALTSAEGWGETDTSVATFEFNEGKDLKGPVSIAVAAERVSPSHTRIVVVGDSDFVINAQLSNVGNRDLALGAIYWLTEQERLIGIGPKPIESIRLRLTGSQLTSVFWISFLAMPIACGLLGVLVWWSRRT